MINGRWRLDSMDVTIAEMPSYCDTFKVGTTFNFKEEVKLLVFPNNSLSVCNNYFYSINTKEISLLEHDMILSFPIEHINSDTLILKSKLIPVNDEWTLEKMEALENGFNMYFTKIE